MTHRVTFIVPNGLLGVVIGAIEDQFEGIEFEKLEKINDDSVSVRKKTRVFKDSIKLEEKLIEFIQANVDKDGIITTNQLKVFCRKHGYSETSASPSASGLHKRGLLSGAGKGKYLLTNKGKEYKPDITTKAAAA